MFGHVLQDVVSSHGQQVWDNSSSCSSSASWVGKYVLACVLYPVSLACSPWFLPLWWLCHILLSVPVEDDAPGMLTTQWVGWRHLLWVQAVRVCIACREFKNLRKPTEVGLIFNSHCVLAMLNTVSNKILLPVRWTLPSTLPSGCWWYQINRLCPLKSIESSLRV